MKKWGKVMCASLATVVAFGLATACSNSTVTAKEFEGKYTEVSKQEISQIFSDYDFDVSLSDLLTYEIYADVSLNKKCLDEDKKVITDLQESISHHYQISGNESYFSETHKGKYKTKYISKSAETTYTQYDFDGTVYWDYSDKINNVELQNKGMFTLTEYSDEYDDLLTGRFSEEINYMVTTVQRAIASYSYLGTLSDYTSMQVAHDDQNNCNIKLISNERAVSNYNKDITSGEKITFNAPLEIIYRFDSGKRFLGFQFSYDVTEELEGTTNSADAPYIVFSRKVDYFCRYLTDTLTRKTELSTYETKFPEILPLY